jgi:hypothetical protein
VAKPPDENYGHLWVDFNFGSKTIVVYCQKHYPIESSAKWDAMTIEASDILKCDVEMLNNQMKILKIHLAREGYLLFDSSAESQFPGFIVAMLYHADEPIEEIIRDLTNGGHCAYGSEEFFECSQPPPVEKPHSAIRRATVPDRIAFVGSYVNVSLKTPKEQYFTELGLEKSVHAPTCLE